MYLINMHTIIYVVHLSIQFIQLSHLSFGYLMI